MLDKKSSDLVLCPCDDFPDLGRTRPRFHLREGVKNSLGFLDTIRPRPVQNLSCESRGFSLALLRMIIAFVSETAVTEISSHTLIVFVTKIHFVPQLKFASLLSRMFPFA